MASFLFIFYSSLQLIKLLHYHTRKLPEISSSSKIVSLITLPQKLILVTREYLNSQRAVNALARTCRYFYNLLMAYLYRDNIEHDYCSAFSAFPKTAT